MSKLILPKERHIYPNKKQFIFMNLQTRHSAYGGARGGGKSWVVREMAVQYALNYGAPDPFHEGIKIVIIRKTLVDLKKNHLAALKLITKGVAKWNNNDLCFYFKNGSTIQFAYCANENDVEHWQGNEADIIIFEEATQLPEEWITKIAASCRGANRFPHRCLYTCNPGGPGHAYIKRVFVDRIYIGDEVPEDYSFVQAKVTDNEVLMEMSPEYIRFLKNLPPKIREAWLDGSWEIYSGQFFDSYVNDPNHYDDRLWTHVINPFKPRPNWPIYRSFDWGSYRPFSVSWNVFSEDDVMYRIMEFYGAERMHDGEAVPNQGLKWTADQVFRTVAQIENDHPWLAGHKIHGVADPAIFKHDGGPSIAEAGYKYGVYFKEGDNRRIAGWDQLRYRMQFNDYGQPRFQIFRNCKDAIRVLPLMLHDDKMVEDMKSDDVEDHIPDEMRYCAMCRPCKPIIPEPEYDALWSIDPLHQMRRKGA